MPPLEGRFSQGSEREGFEPPLRLPADRISNAAPSATRTPLHADSTGTTTDTIERAVMFATRSRTRGLAREDRQQATPPCARPGQRPDHRRCPVAPDERGALDHRSPRQASLLSRPEGHQGRAPALVPLRVIVKRGLPESAAETVGGVLAGVLGQLVANGGGDVDVQGVGE